MGRKHVREEDGGPKRVDPRLYQLPAPQWLLRSAARKGTAAVDPKKLALLLDEVFGPENWNTEVVHPPRIDSDEVVKGKKGPMRIFVASATCRLTVQTQAGKFRRSGTGAFVVRRNLETDPEQGAAGAELALKSAETIAFKRAAARLGRRFGADCGDAESNMRKMEEAARDAARDAMRRAQRLAEQTVARAAAAEGGSGHAAEIKALDRALRSVQWAGSVDPWTTREWENEWRTKIREAKAALVGRDTGTRERTAADEPREPHGGEDGGDGAGAE